jgi:hypothetical protein
VILTEEDILRALGAGEVALPPLAVRLVERRPRLRALGDGSYQPDALVEISRKRRRWKFAAELKANSTPRAFDAALSAIRPAADKAKLLPLIVVPYLSPDNLARLETEGVSGLDLCGNGVVTVADELLVMRTGQPNRYPRSEPIRNVYRGDSSFVGRAFLVQPVYGAVGEIVTTVTRGGGEISFATVSKVLKTLEADLIVGRSSAEIRLLQADKLLDELAENYRPPKAVERFVGNVALGERELAPALKKGAQRIGARLVFTGAASAPRYSVLAREPVVAAYCDVAPNDLLSAAAVTFEETDRFPNVDLTWTRDGLPYFDTAVDDGVPSASPVQSYLELMAGDKRQRETAAQVRDYVLRRVREYRESPR